MLTRERERERERKVEKEKEKNKKERERKKERKRKRKRKRTIGFKLFLFYNCYIFQNTDVIECNFDRRFKRVSFNFGTNID